MRQAGKYRNVHFYSDAIRSILDIFSSVIIAPVLFPGERAFLQCRKSSKKRGHKNVYLFPSVF